MNSVREVNTLQVARESQALQTVREADSGISG